MPIIKKSGEDLSTEMSARTTIGKFMQPTNISASILSTVDDEGNREMAGPALVVEGKVWDQGATPDDSDEHLSIAALIYHPDEAMNLAVNALSMTLSREQINELIPILHAMAYQTNSTKEPGPSLLADYQESLASGDLDLLFREAEGIDD